MIPLSGVESKLLIESPLSVSPLLSPRSSIHAPAADQTSEIVDVADISLTLPDAADADQEDRQIGHQEEEQDLCAALLSPTASLISETFTTPEQVTRPNME